MEFAVLSSPVRCAEFGGYAVPRAYVVERVKRTFMQFAVLLLLNG